ncbi:MAG: ATP-binding protein [Promethearchaeota archaeon]
MQWGALKTGVLGMFYPHPEKLDEIEFSGDINNYVSAHKYRVYAPDEKLLDLIVNSLVPKKNRFKIGNLRSTECRMLLPEKSLPNVPIQISTEDFMGTRTALFGKTRLGKSNVVKKIAESLIKTTEETKNIGQIIFDINGEYANDNPQDGSKSLRSLYEERCVVYALVPKESTPSDPLKLNFYEYPAKSLPVIASFLRQDNRNAAYVRSFSSVELTPIEEIANFSDSGERIRAIRRIQIFWAILKKAGFPVNESTLLSKAPSHSRTRGFNPNFSRALRSAAYGESNVPNQLNTLDLLVRELEIIAQFQRTNPNHNTLTTGSGNPLFNSDDIALLDFLAPQSGRAGTIFLRPYRIYHDKDAGNYKREVLGYIDKGKTVILDLGHANPVLLKYFSDELSKAVFNYQVMKFAGDKLGDHFIQLYFEEAHNLFPHDQGEMRIYSQLAKEGAKYNIGLIYSTQSPTSINKDLLFQTENFFVLHLSSKEQVDALGRLNVAYESLKQEILSAKSVGFMRMLTRSHRFVVSVQALKFSPNAGE